MAHELPVILERRETRLSPWVSVMAKTLTIPSRKASEIFHSLCQADYVSVLAVTEDGRIPLVRQYRPALERLTFELPGGLQDNSDSPDATAVRELAEETGLNISGAPQLIGCLAPDTGRLENKMWGFFVRADSKVSHDWCPESGVECLLVNKAELRGLILDGKFDHALHIALIGLATMRGFFNWD
ncbi:MAG: NUDIX hydrolase [Rhodocyclaceae bacterium]